MEGCGKVDVDARQFQVLHIAIKRTSDDKWPVWEMLHELLGQFACIDLQILFAKLSIEAYLHLSWILIVEGSEIQVCLSHDARIGCPKRHQWHADVIIGGIERHATSEFAHHQSAFLLEKGFLYEE